MNSKMQFIGVTSFRREREKLGWASFNQLSRSGRLSLFCGIMINKFGTNRTMLGKRDVFYKINWRSESVYEIAIWTSDSEVTLWCWISLGDRNRLLAGLSSRLHSVEYCTSAHQKSLTVFPYSAKRLTPCQAIGWIRWNFIGCRTRTAFKNQNTLRQGDACYVICHPGKVLSWGNELILKFDHKHCSFFRLQIREERGHVCILYCVSCTVGKTFFIMNCSGVV